MDKIYRNESRRVFLFENLPAPLTAASSHLQIFDNYIENTRLRIRSVRSPETKKWTFILQQLFPVDEDLSHWKIAEIYLNDDEHQAFERFEGRKIKMNERIISNEIRKNRYVYETGGRQIELDIYLGDLRGLNMARVVCENDDEITNFTLPHFAVLEVSNNPFFTGDSLVGKTLADVRQELAKMQTNKEISTTDADR
jgi:CYTH domain-containing protein